MKKALIVLISSFYVLQISAQDTRTQLLPFLAKTYLGIDVGYINYPFTSELMQPSYAVENINIPHMAAKIIPFGYKFNKYISAQLSYTAPTSWVKYKNINGDNEEHSVTMHIGGISVLGQYPFKERFEIYAEVGMSFVSRVGFYENKDSEIEVVKDASYTYPLIGGGVKYKINKKWTLRAGTIYTPENEQEKQPYSVFHSAGFLFNLPTLPENIVTENAKSGYIFPQNMFQIGYSTNVFSYGINNFMANTPVFWGGKAEIKQGITFHYQRNVFHGKKTFSLDWGSSFSFWESNKNNKKFWTFSLFPLLRFHLLHTNPFDFYMNYSVAGPTYRSTAEVLDNKNVGPHFTFQDFIGVGFYFGEKRNTNIEFRIAHYSNGDIFPLNAGLKIPITFNLGYTF